MIDQSYQTDILNNNYETDPTPQIVGIDVESNENFDLEKDEQSRS